MLWPSDVPAPPARVSSSPRPRGGLPCVDSTASARGQSDGPLALTPGEDFDRDAIVSLLGVGGMGEVSLANDRKLIRKVAIKTTED